jgi:hypothetical protein
LRGGRPRSGRRGSMKAGSRSCARWPNAGRRSSTAVSSTRQVRLSERPTRVKAWAPKGPHAVHPIPLQLEACLGHRRPNEHELRLTAARPRDQERTDRGVRGGTSQAAAAQAADRSEGRRQAQEPNRAPVLGQHARSGPDGAATMPRARPQPRRVTVGLAQASCPRQLPPGQLGRAEGHRAAQARG